MAVAVQEEAYKNIRWPEPLLNLADAFQSISKGMRLMSLQYQMLQSAKHCRVSKMQVGSRLSAHPHALLLVNKLPDFG